MRRVVIVTLDGLRRDMVSKELTPNLIAFARQAERFPDYRTVFPSCTRVVSASMATGCFPARHGLQGNSVALMEDRQAGPARCRPSRFSSAQTAPDGPFARHADAGGTAEGPWRRHHLQ